MNTIQDTMTVIKDEFSIFNDPQEKYVLLVDLAKKSPGLPPAKQTDKNKVNGCISQAWILSLIHI